MLFAGIAQSVEQLIRNQQVACSSHVSSSRKTVYHIGKRPFCCPTVAHLVNVVNRTFEDVSSKTGPWLLPLEELRCPHQKNIGGEDMGILEEFFLGEVRPWEQFGC